MIDFDDQVDDKRKVDQHFRGTNDEAEGAKTTAMDSSELPSTSGQLRT